MKETDTIQALRLEARRLRRLAAVYPKVDWLLWAEDMEAVAVTRENMLTLEKVST